MFRKKILALIASASIALSIATTAQAASPSDTLETIRIGEHDCWVENGEYYTIYEGEKYLVINLDELVAESDSDSLISAQSGTDWMNAEEVEVYNGFTYSEWLDISNADATTKMFVVDSKYNGQRMSMTLHIGTWLPNKYKIDVHTYDSLLGWRTTTHTLTFSLAGMDRLLFDGSITSRSKVCATFLKDGSSGETPFEYKMTTKIY